MVYFMEHPTKMDVTIGFGILDIALFGVWTQSLYLIYLYCTATTKKIEIQKTTKKSDELHIFVFFGGHYNPIVGRGSQ